MFGSEYVGFQLIGELSSVLNYRATPWITYMRAGFNAQVTHTYFREARFTISVSGAVIGDSQVGTTRSVPEQDGPAQPK